MAGRPAAGGGRWVTVAPERLSGWVERFEARHGAASTTSTPDLVTLTAADGAVASVEVPFPPLAPPAHATVSEGAAVALLVDHVVRERTIGVLLVRLGGHAAGVFVGPELVASKVGSRHVQGRSAAGGWSQQRFARRREGQAVVAFHAAANEAAGVLLGRPLDALVVGGDRNAVDAVLSDRRLEPLRPLVTGRLLAVPDPRLKVLQEVPFREVWIRVEDP
ncbi:MAG: hypothetical protein M3P04_06220 [Actinomycetota bacterium]|nr:hypothetical protein [Actinomycetota bacterium]